MLGRMAGVALAAVMCACALSSGAQAAPVYFDFDYGNGSYDTSGHVNAVIDPDNPSQNTLHFTFRQYSTVFKYEGVDTAGYYTYSFYDSSYATSITVEYPNINYPNATVRLHDISPNYTVSFNGTHVYDSQSVSFSYPESGFDFSVTVEFNQAGEAYLIGSSLGETLTYPGVSGDTASLLSPVPLPSSSPLFGAGLIALAGASAWRRRRQTTN